MITNASAHTNFLKADDKLSRLVSALVGLYESQDEAFEDMRMHYAPSECASIIIRGTRNKRRDLFEHYGMTELEFAKRLRQSVSNRWVYYNLNIHEEELE